MSHRAHRLGKSVDLVCKMVLEDLERRVFLTATIDPTLVSLGTEYSAFRATHGISVKFHTTNPDVQVNGDEVRLDIALGDDADYSTVAGELDDMGFTIDPDAPPSDTEIWGSGGINTVGDIAAIDDIDQVIADDPPPAVGGIAAIDPQLLEIYDQASGGSTYGDYYNGSSNTPAELFPSSDFADPSTLPTAPIWHDGSNVTISVLADGATLQTALESIGGQDVSMLNDSTASVTLPISGIPSLVDVPGFTSASPITQNGAITYTINTGGVTQGDAAMQSNLARSSFGVDGTGQMIGIISDSFNARGGYSADVTSHDLPANINAVDNVDAAHGGTDEGRAMAQIVHDVAPGATIAFRSPMTASGAFSEDQYVLAIQQLQTLGCKVIVDDIGGYAEPFFSDTKLTDEINTVTSAGVLYLSAAGNEGSQGYLHSFKTAYSFQDKAFGPPPSTSELSWYNGPNNPFPGSPVFKKGIAHDFRDGTGINQFQTLTLASGQYVDLDVQWDSTFKSESGKGAAGDVDVYFLDASGTYVLGGSSADNRNGDAFKEVKFVNGASTTQSFKVMLVRRGVVGKVKYIDFVGSENGLAQDKFTQYYTNSGTVYGHAQASGTFAVAAAPVSSPDPSVTPTAVEAFSSRSSNATLDAVVYDRSGNNYATPSIRREPAITGPDGVYTTVPPIYYPNGQIKESFNPFFGTSAAAPHVAAVAALMRQSALNHTLTPSQIESALELTATDMYASIKPGFDNVSGSGFVNAKKAVAQVRVTNNGADGSGITHVLINGTTAADEIHISRLDDENLLVTFNDTEIIVPVTSDTELDVDGNEGDDSITIDDDVPVAVTSDGGEGNDTLLDYHAMSRLIGGDGDDTLAGSGGSTYYDAGDGDNTIIADESATGDTIVGFGSNDTLLHAMPANPYGGVHTRH